MIIDAFKKAYATKLARNWNKIFVAVDLHDTIFKSDYGKEFATDWVNAEALIALQKMSMDPEICLIMYTCSHQKNIDLYMEELAKHDIHFEYANWNPEVPNTLLSDFSGKFYFNIMIDDKAGFVVDEWKDIVEFLNNN